MPLQDISDFVNQARAKKTILLIVVLAIVAYLVFRILQVRYASPPSAHSVIVWVHWPHEINGHYEISGDSAQDFVDFAWHKTHPADFFDVAQYRIINFFCLDQNGKVTRGVYVRAGRRNATFNTVEKIAKKAALGRRMEDQEDTAIGPKLRRRLHETHRIYIE